MSTSEGLIMEKELIERRSEPRSLKDEYYGVNFSIDESPSVYQFLIWDTSSKGRSLLVREDSDVLEHLRIGQVLNMKYYRKDPAKPVEFLKTEIRHISRDVDGRFKGHFLVGVEILEGHNIDEKRPGHRRFA